MRPVRLLTKQAIKSIFGHRLVELWQSPEEELEMYIAKIRASMERIPEKIAHKTELFAHFNAGGNKPPIFCCFNTWTEAVFLAYHLGPDRPLYAMHSFCDITDEEPKKSMHSKRLAEIYGDLLCKLYPDGPILLGGICQATSITEAMAHYLLEKRGQAPMLITLASQPFYAYPGDVLMLFGDQDEARFNPFLSQKSPIQNWKNKHRHPMWGFINSNHDNYFREPSISQLTWFIKESADHFLNGVQCPPGELIQNNQSTDLNKIEQNHSQTAD